MVHEIYRKFFTTIKEKPFIYKSPIYGKFTINTFLGLFLNMEHSMDARLKDFVELDERELTSYFSESGYGKSINFIFSVKILRKTGIEITRFYDSHIISDDIFKQFSEEEKDKLLNNPINFYELKTMIKETNSGK